MQKFWRALGRWPAGVMRPPVFTNWHPAARLPPSPRDWETGALSSLRITFQKDGPWVLETDNPGL